MANVIEGDLTPPAGRFAVVAARFNDTIVNARRVDIGRKP